MKLFFCPVCQDVRKLGNGHEITCQCGRSGGWYKDDLYAVVTGAAIPVGFTNSSFSKALRNRPQEGVGKVFEAFVIPVECPTIERIEKTNLPDP